MKLYKTWHLRKGDDFAAYNLLGAIRGPDASDHNGLSNLKDIVTQRVRSIVFRSVGVAGDYRSDQLDEQEVREVRTICVRLKRRSQQEHFRQHLYDAVKASAEHPIWGGLAQSLMSALVD